MGLAKRNWKVFHSLQDADKLQQFLQRTGNTSMSEIFLCGGAADATVLSNVFIDEYLKDANDAQLKVYLFLVRRLQAGDPVSISDMADRFNHCLLYTSDAADE